MAMYRRTMTVADLAELLDVDWHQAARLADPKRSSKLTTLTAALGVFELRGRNRDQRRGPDRRWRRGGERLAPNPSRR
jgi:hypothetical protein